MRILLLFAFIAIFLSCGTAWRTFLRGRSKYGNIGTPKLSKEHDLPPEQWFKQQLDHFNPTDARTWEQRYFVNSDFYKPNGPVFIMIGGEGDASAKWMVEGQWIEYAKQFGAKCFQIEHRFYGKSQPTADLSVKNLVYLTSQQALADIALFIEEMIHLHQIPASTKFIVFGGSYSGSLAAWMRLKYPYLVHGAVSTSGPLLAQLDFQEYFVIVENSLKTHSQDCVDAITQANNQIHIMLRHPLGQRGLVQKFNLCDPIDTGHTKNVDIANLYETLAGNLAEIVQYNKDNRNGSHYTIDSVCDILVDQKRGTPVDRFAEVNNLMLTASKEKCLDYSYSKMINELRNVTWKEQKIMGGRQWFYQTCTEFGFFQTSTARPKLVSDTFPVDFFIEQCADVFGPRFRHVLDMGIERTNIFYGALDLELTNAVFVHGSIDPWHALGITESTNPEAPSIYIKGTAHCANMYPSSKDDIPELVEARKQIGDLIDKWLKN